MSRTSTGRITIHDVADYAGVSFQTVSRVVNQRPDVALETRQRVLVAISELGYQPNAVARSLVMQKTHVLGLVTIDFEDYFFAGVCHGIQEETRKHGYILMITSTDRYPELEAEYVKRLYAQRVDGIIVIRDTDVHADPPPLVIPPVKDMPFVVTSFRFLGEAASLVDIDNENGAKQVGEHFLANGHHEVAIISAPDHYKVTEDRNRGFLSAFSANGLSVDPALIVGSNWHFEGGYQAARELLSRGRNFTALFAHNDQMAIGAMRAIQEAGLRVPQDIAVAGYDDIPVAAHLDTPLTTVWQPRYEMGATAVRMIINKLSLDSVSIPDQVLLTPRLVPRATVQARVS